MIGSSSVLGVEPRGFNSLQTGRAWELGYATRKGYLRMFPFPTNGKAQGNYADGDYLGKVIPTFPFPTNGKVHVNLISLLMPSMQAQCFHSLRTGKYMGTRPYRPMAKNTKTTMFPFPTNGKVHGNKRDRKGAWLNHAKFPFPTNGKVHGNENTMKILVLMVLAGFHSLRTGKYMGTLQ